MHSSLVLLLGSLASVTFADAILARQNSGISGIHTGGEESSAPVTVVFGTDSYTMDGVTGDPVQITSTGDSSGMGTTTARTTEASEKMETAASTSPIGGMGAKITQAPMLAAGIAGVAYLAL